MIGGTVDLVGLEIGAVVEGILPTDDPRELVSLGRALAHLDLGRQAEPAHRPEVEEVRAQGARRATE